MSTLEEAQRRLAPAVGGRGRDRRQATGDTRHATRDTRVSSRIADAARPYLEAHDGEVAEFALGADGRLVLRFASLSVFVQQPGEPDAWEVWLHRAEVTLIGVSRLLLEGPLRETDTVSDLELQATDGSRIELADLQTPSPVARARLQLAGSGATLDVNCTSGHAVLGERLRHLETWTGRVR